MAYKLAVLEMLRDFTSFQSFIQSLPAGKAHMYIYVSVIPKLRGDS